MGGFWYSASFDTISLMLDVIIHKYLRIPYSLAIHQYKKSKTSKKTIVFLHGIGSSGSMWNSVTSKDIDATVIVIDLLGFGKSPKPSWAQYNAKTQARAVVHTLRKYTLLRPVTLVGHSMGALVAVELAKQRPSRVKQLILCSPPFYKQHRTAPLQPHPAKLIKRFHSIITTNPDQFLRLTAFATKYNLVNPGFSVTNDTIASYSAALEGMILNQTSWDDATNLRVPTNILYGAFDPFIVPSSIKELERKNELISSVRIPVAHEVRGVYINALLKTLQR